MCGIAGIFNLEGQPIRTDELRAMIGAIEHRGPDDEGYVLVRRHDGHHLMYSGNGSSEHIRTIFPSFSSSVNDISANLGLGHRRFSIVELSEAGHQPFFDQQRTCSVIFNGEIYNYLEIRNELSAQGINFSTQSDTEVLVEAYKFWGMDCFERFNGFWALALYDFRQRKLILCRDRLGKKPLFWTKSGSTIYFASEIKALLKVPEIRRARAVNELAALRWLTLGQKDLGTETFFEGIYSFPSASWCVVENDFPNKMYKYWNVPRVRLSEHDISIVEAASKVKALLDNAVRLRQRADVPVAVELSGGIDSSILAALASFHQPVGMPLSAVTVRFPQEEWNEEPFARAVARQFGLDHHVIDSPSPNFWAQILPFTYLEEEPYHSPNLLTNQAVWAQMRDCEVKISLNGAGGDEVFAGYAHYFALVQNELRDTKDVSAWLHNALHHTESRSVFHSMLNSLPETRRDQIRSFIKSFSKSQRVEFPFKFSGLNAMTKSVQTLSERLRIDVESTLLPYWLTSGDRGYMGVPIEVRAPFLDFQVMDFAFQLPVTYLIRNGWHKWILRKAMEDVLPSKVLWRRQKLGFPFPIQQFYQDNEEIIDLILCSANNPYVDASKKGFLRRDWRAISFILWYELFINENLELFKEIELLARCKSGSDFKGYVPGFLVVNVK